MDLTGPSFILDSACSSSGYALHLAYSAIKRGDCDAAFVCGASLFLKPNTMIVSAKADAVNLHDVCRPFDQHADGYVKSEAIGVLFLQRKRDAKRVYASVVHSKVNCDGHTDKGNLVPSVRMQTKLMSEFYEELNIEPSEVKYVEAHGTGIYVF
jgi:fatty acid synthase